MEFHQPLSHKRLQPFAQSPIRLQSFGPAVDAAQASPSEPQALGQPAELYGSSSSLQIYDNTVPASSSSKRRRLDSHITMPVGNVRSSPPSFLDKSAKLDPLSQRVNDQPPIQTCWSESAASPSFSLGTPLSKNLTNLSLLLCPCSAFGWDQPNNYYYPLAEASPTVYDPHQPYTAEKQPSMTMSLHTERQGLDLLNTHQNSTAHHGNRADALSSLVTCTGDEQLHMLPPSDSPDEVLNPQILSAMNHRSDEYPEKGSQSPNLTKLPPDYSSNSDQPPANRVSAFADAHVSGQGPSPDVAATCAGNVQFGIMSAGGAANYASLDSWDGITMQEQSSNFDTLRVDHRGGKRGPFKDLKLREQTAETRRIGSCIRCKIQRIRCESDPDNPTGICLTCLNVASTKAGRFPCLRYKITDIQLYKPGQVPGYEWTRRWTNNITDPIQKWASPDIKVIRVSAACSSRYVELRVRKFIPQEGDKIERTWVHNGTRKSVAIPPYALVDLEEARSTYLAYIEDVMADTVYNVLDCPEALPCKTYSKAMQLMRDPSTPEDWLKLLHLTFTLWVSIRLSTSSGFLVGEETLDMPNDILDETSPDAGKIPIPPVLGAQLDLVLIHHIQTKIRRDMLETFQKIVLKNKQITWLLTYLVTFIWLHNMALITAQDAAYARKHGMKRRFAREDTVKEYVSGANTLLAYFHYCNKGTYPFSDECKDKELRTLADLNEEEIRFVHGTRTYAKQHQSEWRQLQGRRKYEDDFFFVSLLFDEDWKPLPVDDVQVA